MDEEIVTLTFAAKLNRLLADIGFTRDEFETLFRKDRLSLIHMVARGDAVITVPSPLIDATAMPPCPDGMSVYRHDTITAFEWNAENVLAFQHTEQRRQQTGIQARNLLPLLEGKSHMNATVLHFLYEHPGFIPDSWKQRSTRYYFWGTLYVDAAGQKHVPYLAWFQKDRRWYTGTARPDKYIDRWGYNVMFKD